jgi:glycosyltransferase involved in cell wall biosynthesis
VSREPAPKLSVVMPCLNAEATIGAALEALTRQTWSQPWEILLADNGSTDLTAAVVERFRERMPNLRVIDASAKPGSGFAMNTAAREARGEWLAICDADDEVGQGWLAAVGEALSQHELVAYRQEHGKLNEGWLRETREREFSERLPILWFPPHVPFTGAGCLAMHRALFERLGGFDESVILEDLDFCIRVQAQGASIELVPDALLHYRYRHTIGGIFRQAFRYGTGVAQIQRRYKRPGERYPGQRKWLLTGWRPVLWRLLRAHRRGHRAKIVWQLGWQLGRYYGSLRFRVLAI